MDKVKILYVDDEVLNLMLFEANLEKKFNILTAESGSKGLEILKQHSDIKIVFSDMKMPAMNGIEFLEEARKITNHHNFYILTGFEINQQIKEAIESGLIQKYFKKPFQMPEIIKEIDIALSA